MTTLLLLPAMSAIASLNSKLAAVASSRHALRKFVSSEIGSSSRLRGKQQDCSSSRIFGRVSQESQVVVKGMGKPAAPVLLLDVMGTLVRDPFYEDIPAFFGYWSISVLRLLLWNFAIRYIMWMNPFSNCVRCSHRIWYPEDLRFLMRFPIYGLGQFAEVCEGIRFRIAFIAHIELVSRRFEVSIEISNLGFRAIRHSMWMNPFPNCVRFPQRIGIPKI